jgi:hypothetical protein
MHGIYLRITHTEYEGLRPIFRPKLGIVERARVPDDFHEEQRKMNMMTRGAFDTEESTRRVRDVTLRTNRAQYPEGPMIE